MSLKCMGKEMILRMTRYFMMTMMTKLRVCITLCCCNIVLCHLIWCILNLSFIDVIRFSYNSLLSAALVLIIYLVGLLNWELRYSDSDAFNYCNCFSFYLFEFEVLLMILIIFFLLYVDSSNVLKQLNSQNTPNSDEGDLMEGVENVSSILYLWFIHSHLISSRFFNWLTFMPQSWFKNINFPLQKHKSKKEIMEEVILKSKYFKVMIHFICLTHTHTYVCM